MYCKSSSKITFIAVKYAEVCGHLNVNRLYRHGWAFVNLPYDVSNKCCTSVPTFYMLLDIAFHWQHVVKSFLMDIGYIYSSSNILLGWWWLILVILRTKGFQ